MSEKTYVRQHWKASLNIFTLTILCILIFFLRSEIATTVRNLTHVHAWALILLIPLEAWNYDAQARLYRSLFGLVGNKLSYGIMYGVALELNFVNNIFPSGGISGISYFGMRMRSTDNKITGGKATVVQTMKLMLTFLSFELLLILGLLFMAVGGRVNDVTILVATSISTLLVIGTFAFMYILASTRRINATLAFASKMLNWLIHLVRPKRPETIRMDQVRRTVEELHSNYNLIKDNYRGLKKPFLFALITNITEVLAVYVIYIAFGHWVNIGAIILAYAVANFAGLVSVLPGGIGVYEALMTAVLAAAGIPASLSIPVVVMYRILNTIIQLPPGYYFYHRTLHNKGLEDVRA
ncbi:MAG TPA: lysylphosphatidylglycerol synthase transmembrane domain-containing protein [Candidatus Saccharimonadales bacterium]|nr:lysylphosphatidylglycerol synthase transmembrane domain-containing protein [Candidatus Saccharimonadales bacterium]